MNAWIPTPDFLATLPPAIHSAAVIVPDQHGHILLLHDAYDQARADTSGTASFKWWLPGGYLDSGETPAQGAERELEEETGLKAGQMRSVGSNYASATSRRPAITNYVFAARPLDAEQVAGITLSAEHDAYRFVAPESIKAVVQDRHYPILASLLKAWADGSSCTLFNGHTLGGRE